MGTQQKRVKTTAKVTSSPTAGSTGLRLGLALLLPPLLAGLVGIATGRLTAVSDLTNQATALPLLAVLGISSWFLGLRWYGLAGMGLRGKRPLFASIGFAVLGWVALLLIRIYTVESETLGTGFRQFSYLLLFEAFAVQLWVFGLMFHALADWRGPLTAAFGSGILFGMTAFLLFQEPAYSDGSSLLYFGAWGIFYGIIRLRTGSLLGAVLVQALQSFTAWVVLQPVASPDPAQLAALHWITAVLYLIFIWRLWPKREDDYRV